MFARTARVGQQIRGGFVETHWMEDENAIWWVDGAPDQTAFYKYDARKNAKTPLFDVARVRKAVADAIGREPAGSGAPFSRFSFEPGERSGRFSIDGREYLIDLATYKVQAAPTESDSQKDSHTPRFLHPGSLALVPPVYESLSPDGQWFVGTRNGNLYLRSAKDGRIETLTDDAIKDFGWNWDGWAVETPKWSPDGSRLAAIKTDERGVPLYPVVHWLKPDEEVDWIRLPKGAHSKQKSEVYIFDVKSRRKTRVDGGNTAGDAVYRFRGWRRDGSELLLTRTDGQRLDFLSARSETGAARTLFTESTKTFFDVAVNMPTSPNFAALADDRRFLWISERDGWNQIYLYDVNGKLIRKLTDEKRPVVRVKAIDEKAGQVYYTAYGAEGRPYDLHFYRVSLEGGKAAKLTDQPGLHDHGIYEAYIGRGRGEDIDVSPSRQLFVDSHSDVARAPETDLRRADGTLVAVLGKAAVDPAAKALVPFPPEEFAVKAADGKTNLHGILYKPYDFDPAKKYPVLDSIYGGPQVTQVARTFRGIWQPQAYAQLGFIVFTVDARGTPNRGKEFHDVVYGNFGRNEIPDHVASLKQLAASRPYMDLSRVGVFGTSFGGYFTIRAMLLAPDVFHVGVATAPITDLVQSPAPEPFMGPYESNKAAYEYGSSVRLAGNLKGHLLLIHGTSDLNAPFSATVQLIDALVKAGKPYDLIVLPEQNHSISGQSAVYAGQALRRYLNEHLKP
jgi:dipeptidyl aminopeptidase/acylaminoacyl peptidase